MEEQGDWLVGFDSFVGEVRQRLDDGHTEYGGASFRRTPEELKREVKEELLDVCAWAFILHRRVEALQCDVIKCGGNDER